ncbi:MAG: ABC transporter permease, partial [Bacteroidota bacterium]
MVKNYLKIAWRNLLKNKVFSLINIIGLSFGVAACILISVYIIHESSYDKHVANSSNIYRMIGQYLIDGRISESIHFSANMAPTVLHDFAEVENSGRLMENSLFYGAGSNEIRIAGQQMQHHEEGFTYADQSIIDILDIQMVYGDASSALSEPNTLVISETISKKYFGNSNPVGKVIYLNNNNDTPFRINGVMQDFPSNSHLDYTFLITLKEVEFGEGEQTRWTQNNYFTYIVLKEGVDVIQFEKKMSNRLINDYILPASREAGFAVPDDIEEKYFVKTQALTDINLYSKNVDYEASTRNDIKIIWIFGVVALFILAIASINFVNLSTAKSANRAKEVGVRKVVGAPKRYLIGQFLTESVLLSLISFALGLGIAWLMMPLFNSASGKALSLPFTSFLFVPLLILSALAVGLLAGLYPSFYLSRFRPVSVLKGKLSSGSRSSAIRSGLVVFQFTISIILIIGTLIVNRQMDFILNSKIGFDKEEVVQLYGTNILEDRIDTFKNELENINGVARVTISDYLPIEGTKRNNNGFVNEGRDNIDETVGAQSWIIDEDYLETLGMRLVEGRNFDINKVSDDETTIINQAMAEKLNLEQPLGKKISRYGRLYEVIGVVEDFNYNSMKQEVQPLCFFRGMSPSIISLKASAGNITSLLHEVEKKWNTFSPNMAFRYAFMNDSFAKMYDSVTRIRTIFMSFSILAILVACLGLFALSAFMVEQRKKEISIRMVLGASFKNIYSLLSINFLRLVGVSIVMAIPVGWYVMNRWLEDFAYKTTLDWTIFLMAGCIALIIALFTISYQSISAALIQPLRSLRN